MVDKFTFVGCSFTVGEGLELEKNDPNLYANIVSKKYSASVKNLASCGNSNHEIFMTAINDILFERPDKIFVQWSAMNRLRVHPGPNTELSLSHTITQDYHYRDMFYSKKKELQHLTNHYGLINLHLYIQ